MSQTTVLFTSGYPDDEMRASLSHSGYEILKADEKDAKSAASLPLDTVEVLVCYHPFSWLDIDRLPRLRWIHLVSRGINHLPADKIISRGIIVTNTAASTSVPISEWIVMQLLFLYKQAPFFIARQQAHSWELCENILELFHKKALFLGTGLIAQEAARRLSGFEMLIDGTNRSGHLPGDMFHQCFPVNELARRIGEYDIIVSALPATRETYHLLDMKMLSALKPTAVVLNISRGSVIDTPALCALLNEGRLRGAALDVFETEPLPADSPLWETRNLFMTPHNSYLSEYYSMRNSQEIFDNLMRYIKKEPLHNYVDFRKGY